MEEFLTFNATWPRPWIGPYSIPSCITHRPLPTYQISLRSDEKFSKGHISIFFQVQSHATQKLGKISKIRREQIQILSSSLRISSHLPATMENGGWDRFHFENERISNFQRHVTLTLDRAIWHTVVHHSSTSTYTKIISFESGKLFADGRTDGRTYGQTSRPALLGWLAVVDLIIIIPKMTFVYVAVSMAQPL